jgi:hypothetical protein
VGLFGKKKEKYIDPVQMLIPSMRWVPPAQAEELKKTRQFAEETREELGRAAAPTVGRFEDYLRRGQFMSPEEQMARERTIGYAQQLMQTGAGQYMGGFDPAQQRRATIEAFEHEVPEQLRSMLTQAGLQAPGIHHGRVREEVARRGADLGTALQTELARQNLAAAEFGRGAEQLAAQQRMYGAQMLPQAAQFGGFTDIMQREMAAQNYLQQLLQAPEQAYMQYITPLLTVNPMQYMGQMRQEYKPGFMDYASGMLGAAGQIGGLIGAFSDERLKDNIKPIGTWNGFTVYEFTFKGNNNKHIGLMAQDVEKTRPDAIMEVHGMKAINYTKLGVI